MAVLFIYRTPVFSINVPGQRQITRAAQRIFHTGRIHSPEFIGEAEVDVVLEPSLTGPIMSCGVERLHDLFLASLPILGSEWQAFMWINRSCVQSSTSSGRANLSACFLTQLRT